MGLQYKIVLYVSKIERSGTFSIPVSWRTTVDFHAYIGRYNICILYAYDLYIQIEYVDRQDQKCCTKNNFNKDVENSLWNLQSACSTPVCSDFLRRLHECKHLILEVSSSWTDLKWLCLSILTQPLPNEVSYTKHLKIKHSVIRTLLL